jgi:ribosome-binding factor A
LASVEVRPASPVRAVDRPSLRSDHERHQPATVGIEQEEMVMARQRAQTRHQFNRTDRISETVREVVATELERIGDERVDMVTVTNVTVDNDLNTAKVYYSALTAEAEGRLDEVAEALDEIRWPIQRAVNAAIRARKTPQIEFLPDDVLAAALRIDDILNHRVDPSAEQQQQQ